MDNDQLYRRNPDILLEWGEDTGPALVDCRRWRKFSVKPVLVGLLHQLERPLTAEELHDRWQESDHADEVRKLLERLASAGIIQRCAPADGAETDAMSGGDGWTPYELAVHAQSGRGPVPGARRGTPPPARLAHPEATEVIALPDGRDAPSRPLAEVLAERRSVRAFAPSPVPLPLIGAFLDRTARVRGYLPPRAYEQTHRPAPSGGGRHSLEVYVLAREVAGLASGAYHYDPFAHTLHRLSPWTEELAALQRRTVIDPAAMAEAPPVGIYLASCAGRTTWKYEGMSLSLIYRDTGCLMQTMCLTATDLGLASCLTGAMETPVTAPFLTPHRSRLIHVGNLALGLPTSPSAAPALEPPAHD
ncbi:SagB family peptide dehydrogenase [Streptomyces sp. GMY02]|uniref:SagB family peptide dehydrogenase n=1 Tax=Streptomyces sp. GMY02 TaxID=1333528 RepID=UPI001C2BD468|nr:SagB family peptide dehydrogenase [Streptomyces sp. GMY02]QXE38287.1 SagB family peptide dehydrogenase [Streptomyces sp. GMY02]